MKSHIAFVLMASSAALSAQAPPRPDSGTGPKIYFEYEVDKPVAPSKKNKAPKYPKELNSSGVDGQVVAKFAVDSTGKVMLPSVIIVSSDNDAFTKSVRDVLPGLRFSPAEKAGKKVNQMIQMAFAFSLAPPADTGSAVRPAAPLDEDRSPSRTFAGRGAFDTSFRFVRQRNEPELIP